MWRSIVLSPPLQLVFPGFAQRLSTQCRIFNNKLSVVKASAIIMNVSAPSSLLFFSRSLDHAYTNKKTAEVQPKFTQANRKHGCLIPRQSVDYRTAVWLVPSRFFQNQKLLALDHSIGDDIL
jgi:hypothetical protein